MTDIITLVEEELTAGWQWVENKAIALYDAAKPIFEHALATIQAFTIQDLWGAAAAFVTKLLASGPISTASGALADLEQAFLMAMETLKSNWLPSLVSLGSNLLQTLLGLISAQAVHATA